MEKKEKEENNSVYEVIRETEALRNSQSHE